MPVNMPISNSSFNPNPFTLVFDALWKLLENSPNFIADVKVSNRIHVNLANLSNPLKTQINDADLPEVILVSNGADDINLFNTSATSKIVKTYSFLLSTGDIRVNNYLHQVEWDIFCAMTGWVNILGGLTWPVNDTNHHFVKKCNLTNVTEGLADNERNRDIKGWSAIWSCMVEMWFANSDLATYRGY